MFLLENLTLYYTSRGVAGGGGGGGGGGSGGSSTPLCHLP